MTPICAACFPEPMYKAGTVASEKIDAVCSAGECLLVYLPQAYLAIVPVILS
jgi:hypothetical protein